MRFAGRTNESQSLHPRGNVLFFWRGRLCSIFVVPCKCSEQLLLWTSTPICTSVSCNVSVMLGQWSLLRARNFRAREGWNNVAKLQSQRGLKQRRYKSSLRRLAIKINTFDFIEIIKGLFSKFQFPAGQMGLNPCTLVETSCFFGVEDFALSLWFLANVQSNFCCELPHRFARPSRAMFPSCSANGVCCVHVTSEPERVETTSI